MNPATRHLLLTWIVLMGLTLTLGVAGDVAHASRLGAAWLAVIGVVTVVKARLVLARYLRLEVAPSFLSGFTGALAATVALIVVSFALLHQPLIKTSSPPREPAAIHAPAPRG